MEQESIYLLTHEEVEQFIGLIYKLQEAYWEIMDRRRVEIPSLHGKGKIGPATRSLHEAFRDLAKRKELSDEYEAHLENIKKNKIIDDEIEF